MPKGKGTYFRLASAAIFIILEVAALGMLKKSSTLQDIWLNRLSHRVMAVTWGTGETIRNYFNLTSQNEQLVEENRALMEELQAYRAMDEEYKSRRTLLEGGFSRGFRYMTATIVKLSQNKQSNYIILNKGSEDGVKTHSGIITGSGVVGIIYAVDKHYSYGLTLMNPKFSVSARIGQTGITAPMSWDGKHTNRAIMRDIPLHLDIAPGDTVWTTGFSSIYPADIPLGVTAGSYLENGASTSVEVDLFQDFSSLRYVIIAENPERESIVKLEEQ